METRSGTPKGGPDRPSRTAVHYMINGERQQTGRNPLTVEEILRHAGTAAGIDLSDLTSYYLESVTDDREFWKLGDKVQLRDGDQFLAIYSGRTPVA